MIIYILKEIDFANGRTIYIADNNYPQILSTQELYKLLAHSLPIDVFSSPDGVPLFLPLASALPFIKL